MELDLSEKLRAFIDEVEEETGRSVVFKPSCKIWNLKRVTAAFEQDPADIVVLYYPDASRERLDSNFAHEIAHGLLVYARGYYPLSVKEHTSIVQRRSIRNVENTALDIVVHKHLFDKGFVPFSATYPNTLRTATRDAKRNRTFFNNLPAGLERETFMVLYYLVGWGYLEYLALERPMRTAIRRFHDRFRRAYPSECQNAHRFRDIIRKNNIFGREGYHKTLREALALWALCDLVDWTAPGVALCRRRPTASVINDGQPQ